MNLIYIENPRPIQLSTNEEKVVNDILSNLEKLMFGKWKKQRGAIGNTLVFETVVPIKRWGRDKATDVHIKVRGSKRNYNKGRPLFGFTSGVLRGWRDKSSGELKNYELEVHLNGWTKKNAFAKAKKEDPFEFWKSYLGFKSTIRHELIHAKDPNKFDADQYGTTEVSRRFGHIGYLNDPNRTEFRAHLGEWDILTDEIKDVVDNRNKKGYKGVWRILENFFCQFVSKSPKDINDEFIKVLEMDNLYNSPIPGDLARRLTANKEFHFFPLNRMNSMINHLEERLKPRWKAFYEDQNKEYRHQKKKRQNSRWDLERAVRNENLVRKEGVVFKSKLGQNRAGIMNEVKKRMKKLYPKPLPKKPKLKTQFTKEERQNILDYRQNNYPDMVSAIYSLFKKKGLLNPSLCSYAEPKIAQKILKKQSIEERKQLIFTALQKSVIRSLSSRFESLETE